MNWLSPMLWTGIAFAAVMAWGGVQTLRLDAAHSKNSELQAQLDLVAEQGAKEQEKAKNDIATAKANAKAIGGKYESDLARVSHYYIDRLRALDPGAVSTAGADPGQPDGTSEELAACRGGLEELRGRAAGDALQLRRLQELLVRNGHPVQ